MRYIDAEKLIAEIERRIQRCEDCEREGYPDTTSSEATLKSLRSFIITSLQQEQTNAYDVAMLEVKEYVDKLYDDASIGLNEYESGLYNGIVETCMKLRGFIKARTSKERSEVDLEKEIEKYFSKWVQGASDEGCFNADSQLVSIYDCHRLARYFYELGRNARKED